MTSSKKVKPDEVGYLKGEVRRLTKELELTAETLEMYERVFFLSREEIKDRDKMLEALEKAAELSRLEQIERDKALRAHESIEALARTEMLQKEEILRALEMVQEMSRNELIDKTRLLEAQESIQKLARQEQMEKAREMDTLREVGELFQDEKKRLQIRNYQMENDLTMARNIQKQLIPSKSPSTKIAFTYKPTEKVGGDFYDFIFFREKHLLGIFLSDVSGHGVAAAFITSLIKGFMAQSETRRKDPGALLTYLNDVLYNQTAGHFVTAFYGVYNFKDNKLQYANAGHNLPIIIEEKKYRQFSSRNRGMPLAIYSKVEQKKMKKGYRNVTIELKPGSKILFYTDGLVEASSEDRSSTTDFEEADLKRVCQENKHLPAAKFIEAVYSGLAEFSGSESFADDVCMICLDV